MESKTEVPELDIKPIPDAVTEQNPDGVEGKLHELMTADEERALVRKIDLYLLPLLWCSYMLQFLDKTTLGYSAILGLQKDTGLVGDQYSWASSAFYYGYLVASYPASFGFIKLPLAKYLSVTMIIWAIVLCCHAAASSFASLTVLRVFLGVFESTISPGFTLITGIWYKPSEHALRTCLWFSGNTIAAIFGGILSYGIGHIEHSMAAWRWLFIIFGLITLVWAVCLLIFLPDSPMNARWLTEEQRKVAMQRPQAVQKSFKSTKWQKDQFIEALIDPKTWLLAVYNVAICVPNGGITNFSSLIIRGFGFNVPQTLLLGMPGPAISLCVLLVAAYISTRFRRMRCYAMAGTLVLSLIGILLVRQLPTSDKWGRLIGIWISFVFGCGFPLSLSIISSNVAGYTKKTTVAAVLFMAYCAGNIGGPMVFKAKEAPHYSSAYAAIIACLCIGIVSILALRFYMAWENGRRDREMGFVIDAEPKEGTRINTYDKIVQEGSADLSDWANKYFRYCL